MLFTQKRLTFILMLGLTTLTSCLSDLKPLPDKVGDLDLSLSIPVAKAEFGISNTYHIGPPNWFLTQDVPDWAKYDYIYIADTVTVDLYRIFENSSDISYLAFKINIWNEFPVKFNIDIFFIDNTGKTLYTFEPITIEKGDILNGDVVRTSINQSKAIFDRTSIDNLRTAAFVVFHQKINLKDGNTHDFKFFDHFKITCQVGARIDFILKDN